MHKYMRAIGFSRYKTRADEQKLLRYIHDNPTEVLTGTMENDTHRLHITELGEGFGIKSLYYVDEQGDTLEYYFPYMESDLISSTKRCEIERHSSELAFGGSYDDPGMDLSVIFYLNNGIEMLDHKTRNGRLLMEGVALSALCNSGKIILPLFKTENDEDKAKTATQQRNRLLEAARNGDEKAMETLAMADMTIFQNIQEHITREDIYTMVDTTFMPYGMESDAYYVLGEITKVKKVRNRFTGEECYQLTMRCNGILITTMINADDLLGAPAPGRRFKGEIWLQGRGIGPEL